MNFLPITQQVLGSTQEKRSSWMKCQGQAVKTPTLGLREKKMTLFSSWFSS